MCFLACTRRFSRALRHIRHALTKRLLERHLRRLHHTDRLRRLRRGRHRRIPFTVHLKELSSRLRQRSRLILRRLRGRPQRPPTLLGRSLRTKTKTRPSLCPRILEAQCGPIRPMRLTAESRRLRPSPRKSMSRRASNATRKALCRNLLTTSVLPPSKTTRQRCCSMLWPAGTAGVCGQTRGRACSGCERQWTR